MHDVLCAFLQPAYEDEEAKNTSSPLYTVYQVCACHFVAIGACLPSLLFSP